MKAKKTVSIRLPEILLITIYHTGSETAAEIVAADTFRDMESTVMNTTAHAGKSGGNIAVKIPAPVAAPFPPRKPVKTGKRCPVKAAVPDRTASRLVEIPNSVSE